MIDKQLEQLLALLHQQTDSQEQLTEQLTKANAMVALALSENFLDHSKSVIHSYLWALSDLVEQAKDLSSQILEALLKGTPTHLYVYQPEGSQT